MLKLEKKENYKSKEEKSISGMNFKNNPHKFNEDDGMNSVDLQYSSKNPMNSNIR